MYSTLFTRQTLLIFIIYSAILFLVSGLCVCELLIKSQEEEEEEEENLKVIKDCVATVSGIGVCLLRLV